jgi:hypothetical protein
LATGGDETLAIAAINENGEFDPSSSAVVGVRGVGVGGSGSTQGSYGGSGDELTSDPTFDLNANNAGSSGSGTSSDDLVSIPPSLVIHDDSVPRATSDWFKLETSVSGESMSAFDEAAFKSALASLVMPTVISDDNMVLVVQGGENDSTLAVKCVIVVPVANGDAVNDIVMAADFGNQMSAALSEHEIETTGDVLVSKVFDDTGAASFESLFGFSPATVAQRAQFEQLKLESPQHKPPFALFGASAVCVSILVAAGVFLAKRGVAKAAGSDVATPVAAACAV